MAVGIWVLNRRSRFHKLASSFDMPRTHASYARFNMPWRWPYHPLETGRGVTKNKARGRSQAKPNQLPFALSRASAPAYQSKSPAWKRIGFDNIPARCPCCLSRVKSPGSLMPFACSKACPYTTEPDLTCNLQHVWSRRADRSLVDDSMPGSSG